MKLYFPWSHVSSETGEETIYYVTVECGLADPDIGIGASYVDEIYVHTASGKVDEAATDFIRHHRQDIEEAFWGCLARAK